MISPTKLRDSQSRNALTPTLGTFVEGTWDAEQPSHPAGCEGPAEGTGWYTRELKEGMKTTKEGTQRMGD